MTPETCFTNLLSSFRPEGAGLTTDVPTNWMQGRTAYGGLTSGLMLGAVQRLHADLPPIRSALVNFTGPVSAPPTITSEMMRQGRNVTTVAARAEVEGKPVATATFSFGAARESHVRLDHAAPEAPAPQGCELFIPEFAKALAPAFHEHFEMRLIAGDRPMSAADHGYVRCWVRHVDPGAHDGAAPLLCLADILPPAVYPMLKKRGPNSSMTWICNFLDEDLSTEDGWWQIETNLSAARDGYSSQVMRAWNTRGDLVIDGMQAVALFV